MLLCADGSLYTGVSNNVEKRFLDHFNQKGARNTKSHKPIKVVYAQEFDSQLGALKRERQIKGWNREKKIKILKINLSDF